MQYNLICLGCNDRNTITHLNEHGSRINQPLHIYLGNCDKCSDIINIMQFLDLHIPVATPKGNGHIRN